MNRKRKFRYKTYRNTPFRPKDRVHRDEIFLRSKDLEKGKSTVQILECDLRI
jgi:hypothetical protein